MDLKFDEMEVDTTLAQKYLSEEKISDIWEATKSQHFDGKTFWNVYIYYGDKKYAPHYKNLKNLATLLEKNIALFAQLEYHIRKIPIEDTNSQINLIIKQLLFVSSCGTEKITVKNNVYKEPKYDEQMIRALLRGGLLKAILYVADNYTHFTMCDKTPLLCLGFVVKAFMCLDASPTIIASQNTTAICYLLTKLCHEAGLTVVTEFGGNSVDDHAGNEVRGTVGVISESSDLDSAVDVFLTSSEQAPWSIRRILVQESVYQQFKDALTWKCNLNRPGEPEPNSTSSSTSLKYNSRIFLIDSVGNTNPQPSEVAIEAYRTRKELLSFLNQYRPHYISLWANDIAEINEVAYNISSQVIWVNNFADFRGPPRVSEAIFSIRSWYRTSDETVSKKEISELAELERSWLKLDMSARYEILYKVLNENEKVIDSLRRACHSSSSFVDVGKDFVCLGVPAPSDKMYFCSEAIISFFSEAFFKSLLNGNAFVFKDGTDEGCVLIDSLKKAGVPVSAESKRLQSEPRRSFNFLCPLPGAALFDFEQVTKVIWTSSGTIFAN